MRAEHERPRSVERRVGRIPRYLARPCPRCGHRSRVLNGWFFRNRRRLAALTLREMATCFGPSALAHGGVRLGVSVAHLSRMERGDSPFPPRIAAAYDRLFERRGRAGAES